MATTFLSKSNNAKTTITNNPLSAGGLSITLATGKGALFPVSGQFIGTLWDDVTYPGNPTGDPNMEIVLCDSRSSDTVTVNASGRGYSGTTGVAHATGSAFALQIMKEHFTEHSTAINTLETPIGFSAYRSANVSANNTDGIVFDTELYDNGSWYNNTTGICTIPVTGYYLFTASVGYSPATDQKDYGVIVVKNATAVASTNKSASGTGEIITGVTNVVYCTAADTLYVQVYENVSGAVTIIGARPYTYFTGQLLIRA
jgi:hypothetical protein